MPPRAQTMELTRDIQRTREALGQTVAALAAKANVKARAREKAGPLARRLKSKGSAAAGRAAAVSSRVKRTAAAGRAAAVSSRVKSTGVVAVRHAAGPVRRRLVPVAAAAVVAVIAVLTAVWRRHR